MFSLSTITSTVLISICGLVTAFLVIYPVSLHKKKKIWLSLKLVFISISLIFVILLLDIKKDSFLFVGSFLGIGFLLKVIFDFTKLRSLYLFLSYLSFTFIFLSLGQIILFILNLGFAYILMIYLSFYRLHNHDREIQDENVKINKLLKPLFTLFGLLTLFGLMLYKLLSDDIVWLQSDSLAQLFSGKYNSYILLIFTCIFFVILIIIFTLDIKKKYTRRKDEPWYF